MTDARLILVIPTVAGFSIIDESQEPKGRVRMELLERVLRALAGLVVLGAWIALIVFGVRAARAKGRSPHWMWFGAHPLGALIAFVVLRFLVRSPQEARARDAVLQGRVVCTKCRALFAGERKHSLWWGLPKYDCSQCKQASLHPLRLGWCIAAWCFLFSAVVSVGVQLSHDAEGGPPVGVLVAFYVVPVAFVVVSDLIVRRRVREAEKAVGVP